MMYHFYFYLIFSIFHSSKCNKPNIIILYIENIKEVINTVNSDPELLKNFHNLTKSSVHFNNMYGEKGSASNFAGLFTGKPAVDLGIIQGKLLPFDYFPSLASTGGLSTTEVTIAKRLKQHGYQTWFTGFWQLGLGKKGEDFPTKHGFDTWMGIAHPHNEWCHRNKEGILSSNHAATHPYIALLYKTSFIWILVLLLLTTVVWFRIISVKLYINFLIYTICASIAFYVLLQLFIIQRSASCVLYYHDKPFQQPYEIKNLTLHLTKHMSTLIQIVGDAKRPFFAVVNYLKMKEPVFHSDIFRTKATTSLTSSLLELDWSIGVIMSSLYDLRIFNDTIIFVTGSSSCSNKGDLERSAKTIFRRKSADSYQVLSDYKKTDWSDCLKVPLFIKDLPNVPNTYNVNSIALSSHIYQTVIDMVTQSTEARTIPFEGLQKHYKTFNNDDKLDEYMYALISSEKNDIQNNFTDDNLDLFIDTTTNDSDSFSWITESSDDDVVIEALVSNERSNKRFHNQLNKQVEAIFHYHNIYRPVMVTYQEKYHVIYSYIDSDGVLQSLDHPVIIDIYDHLKTENKTLISNILEGVYRNVSALLKLHTVDRQNKNPWSSQFEMPVYPWLLPCSNFPLCKTQVLINDDFSSILGSEQST